MALKPNAAGVVPAPPDDRGYFNVTFVAAFAVLLLIALVAQLLMLHWRPWFPGAESEKSLTGGVKVAVCTLMSQLI